jgi:hypothetical protein
MIEFISDTHTYFSYLFNEDFLSGTSLIGKVKPYVDWDKKAGDKAKKIGTTKELLLQEWHDKKINSQILGTRIHSIKEDYYKQLKSLAIDGQSVKITWDLTNEKGNKYTESNILDNNTVYIEKLIFNNLYKVAGQADRIEVINNKINVYDYKTSEKIELRSYKSWEGKYQKLCSPLSHIEDCNFNHYGLQLSLYAYMLSQHNPKLEVGNLVLEHLIMENGEIVGQQDYPIPYLKKEVVNLLNWYKSKK